ncbi:TRAF-interacting with FHA domain-containing A [Pelobates cultripes]|uniref:TRAF-interacting protein with FHA domain-containing protein A n=1 Tax=Pelobates cultripes TaxID=61616 RepID=A0AAD1W9F7_PELCU|nr:TRAF-interacting with FHA domain-containing A [Pelobates cultripes]
MANNSSNVETEQTTTCLHLTFYHPQNHRQNIFGAIPLRTPQEIKAEATVAFGRDVNTCKYVFLCNRASRIQFVIQFFKPLHHGGPAFEIKNVSKKAKLYVDHLELNYLNKVDLPAKCIIQFGDFQMLLEKEEGESEDVFEISCDVSRTPLVQETQERLMVSIPENGILNGSAPPTILKCSIAEETDENQL